MYMIGQNSFSNTNTNPGAYQSMPTQPVPPTPVNPVANQSVPKAPKKPLSAPILVVIGLVAGIAVCAIIYFLFLQPKPEGKTDTSYATEVKESSPNNDGTQTYQDTLSAFDNQISATTDSDDKFSLELNKIGYYIIIEDYDSAISALEAIDINSLDNFDQYRVYNYFKSAYEGKGDEAKAAEYQKLSDEANAKELKTSE